MKTADSERKHCRFITQIQSKKSYAQISCPLLLANRISSFLFTSSGLQLFFLIYKVSFSLSLAMAVTYECAINSIFYRRGTLPFLSIDL